jgi:hypothetical protein
MDAQEFDRRFREAETKLAQGECLTRREQIVLLAGLLLTQPTRKEKRYGQT